MYVSNARLVKGTPVYTSNFTPPTSPLTAITNTVLLTCQSNRFIDTNTQVAAKTITANGSPTIVAFSPFNPTASWSAATYGGSGYFDGNGDYLSYTQPGGVGNGDFTLELWIYPLQIGDAIRNVWECRSAEGSTDGFWLGSDTTNFYMYYASSKVISTSYPTANAWTHVALVRSGNDHKLYFNGTQVGSTYTAANNYSNTAIFISRYVGSAAYYTNGYFSSLRLVKGTAVYTAAFTPPTAPPTAITNTSLLLNFTNAGIYDATSKNDLETVGNAQISTAQSKWGGSSMAFDGTGDYLLSPDQPIQRIGTGNFTIECWVYRNSSGTYGLVGKGTGTTGWLLSLNSSNQVVFTYGSSTITSTGTVSATTWTYIAVVREGTGTNQTKIYINGSNDGTGTVSTDFNQTNSLYVGADRTGGSNANVYLQDLRISNYARTITASPTAAFPTL
jgi:hypothetical protein